MISILNENAMVDSLQPSLLCRLGPIVTPHIFHVKHFYRPLVKEPTDYKLFSSILYLQSWVLFY